MAGVTQPLVPRGLYAAPHAVSAAIGPVSQAAGGDEALWFVGIVGLLALLLIPWDRIGEHGRISVAESASL
jgi:hypothetical protein